MSDEELLKAFEKYVKRAGYQKALTQLVGNGAGLSTAERLVTNRYTMKKPQRRTRDAILGALKQDKAL